MPKRPLKHTPTAELHTVLARHRKTLSRDPANNFSAKAIANINAELSVREEKEE